MTRRHGLPLPAAPFARHKGDHRRRGGGRGSLTGWSVLAALVPSPRTADDVTRPRLYTTPMAPYPMADPIFPDTYYLERSA